MARHIAGIAGGASPGTASNWPTITVGDSESGQTAPNPNRQGGAEHESLRVAAANWPTPHGFNGQDKDGGYGTGGEFEKYVKLWATPNASVANDGEGPETWRVRQAALKEKGINGNGAGVPLSIMAQESAALWATPDVNSGYRDMSKVDPVAQRRAETHRTVGIVTQAVDWTGPASRPDPTTATAGAPSSSSAPTSRLQLNERFVEALMGLPCGWTDCAPSATPWCPPRPKPPSASSGSGPSMNDSSARLLAAPGGAP